jgi:hypothetical protein
MLSCKQVVELLSKSLDTELPRQTRLSVRLHMRLCSLCKLYEHQIKLLRAFVRELASLTESESPIDGYGLSSGAKERIVLAIHEENAKPDKH